MTALRLLAAAAAAGLLGCGGLQKRCAAHPWLLCGDRITVQRPHVYLDDPAFLYNNRTTARRDGEVYDFRLSLFFNPHRLLNPTMTAEIRTPDSAAPPAPCRVAKGPRDAFADPEAQFAASDTTYSVVASSKKERVTLRFLCNDYQPRWGRQDTLELRFAGADSAAPAHLLLPFNTGFHGPIYSFVAGSLMLVTLTAAGEIIAAEK